MKFKLVDPQNGSKVIIEGSYAKSGKTWLASTIALSALKKNKNLIGLGNMYLDHERYSQVNKITRKQLDTDEPKIVLLDEIDTKWTWQKNYWLEGLFTFWGYGASHFDCAVLGTVQHEYQSLRDKLLRRFHIFVKYPLINESTDKPYGVLAEFQKPFYYPLKFFNKESYKYYNFKDRSVTWIDFSDFNSKVLERERSTTRSPTTKKLHGSQLQAVKKLLNEVVSIHGNISKAAQKTGLSRNFFYDIVGREE